jgi:hypothetical protein
MCKKSGHEECEIEITTEMVDVGLRTLYNFNITEPYESEMRDAVTAVYRAMYETHKLDCES